MAFYDDLARDPTSEDEFWSIIDETFAQVKSVLTDYEVETREEAIAGTLRNGQSQGCFSVIHSRSRSAR